METKLALCLADLITVPTLSEINQTHTLGVKTSIKFILILSSNLRPDLSNGLVAFRFPTKTPPNAHNFCDVPRALLGLIIVGLCYNEPRGMLHIPQDPASCSPVSSNKQKPLTSYLL